MKCIFNRFHNKCCILTIDSTYIIFRYDEISNAVYVSLEKNRLYSFTKLVHFYHYYKENTQKCKTVYLLFGVTHMLIPKRIWIHNEIKQEC